MLKGLTAAAAGVLFCSAALAAGSVPPDYNPATAKVVTAPKGFDPSEATTAPGADSGLVPPDYDAHNSGKTVYGAREDLQPRATQLPMSEQLQLIKRNEEDIQAKKAAAAEAERQKAAAAQAAKDRIDRINAQNAEAEARDSARRRSIQNSAEDSYYEFQQKLNKARAKHAEDYVKAELKGKMSASSSEFQEKLESSRARRADQYVDAEIQGIRNGSQRMPRK